MQLKAGVDDDRFGPARAVTGEFKGGENLAG
jgi:hypothetical protein